MRITQVPVHFAAIKAITAKAYLFETNVGTEQWVPLSVCRVVKNSECDGVDCLIASFFFEKIAGNCGEQKEAGFSRPRFSLSLEECKLPVKKHVDQSTSLPQQAEAYRLLVNQSLFVLFMECRSGKTKVAIDILTSHFISDNIDRILWLCPVSVLLTAQFQWKHFCQDESVLPNIMFFGIETMSSCGLKRLDVVKEFVNGGKCAVIIDESQTVKNEKAIRSRRILSIAGKCVIRGILSGTPITRNIDDLYHQLKVLDWTILGYKNKYQFQKNHIILHDKIPGLILETKNQWYITEMLKPFCFEHFRENAGENDRYFDLFAVMTDEQREIYDKIKRVVIGRIERYENNTNDVYLLFSALQGVLAGHLSERIMTSVHRKNHGYIVVPTTKPDVLLKKRMEIEDKAVVWCCRRHEVSLLQNMFPDHYIISGDTPPDKRHEIIRRFRESPQGTLVAMTPVARRGIDMFECDNAFFFGQSFDWESREQAIARLKSPGKDRPCHYYNIMYQDSLDERIQSSHAKKTNTISEFLKLLKEDKTKAIREMREL